MVGVLVGNVRCVDAIIWHGESAITTMRLVADPQSIDVR